MGVFPRMLGLEAVFTGHLIMLEERTQERKTGFWEQHPFWLRFIDFSWQTNLCFVLFFRSVCFSLLSLSIALFQNNMIMNLAF